MEFLCSKVRPLGVPLGIGVRSHGNGYYFLPSDLSEKLATSYFALKESKAVKKILLYFTMTCLATYLNEESNIDIKGIKETFPFIDSPLLEDATIILEKRGILERGDANSIRWLKEEHKILLSREHNFLYNFAIGSPTSMEISSGLRETFDITDVGGIPLIWDYEKVLKLFHGKAFLEDSKNRHFLSFVKEQVEGILQYYMIALTKMMDEVGMLSPGKRTLLKFITELPLHLKSDNAEALTNAVNSINGKITDNVIRKELFKLSNSTERLVVLDGSDPDAVDSLLYELRIRNIVVEYIEPQSRKILVANPKAGPVDGKLVVEKLLSWMTAMRDGKIPLGTGFIAFSGYQLTSKEMNTILGMSKGLLQKYGFSVEGSGDIRRYQLEQVPNSLLEIALTSKLSVLDG